VTGVQTCALPIYSQIAINSGGMVKANAVVRIKLCRRLGNASTVNMPASGMKVMYVRMFSTLRSSRYQAFANSTAVTTITTT